MICFALEEITFPNPRIILQLEESGGVNWCFWLYQRQADVESMRYIYVIYEKNYEKKLKLKFLVLNMILHRDFHIRFEPKQILLPESILSPYKEKETVLPWKSYVTIAVMLPLNLDSAYDFTNS